MKSLYITFDRYYNVDTYNSFKVAAKNNGIEFEEYIKIRPPYIRFLKIKTKKDLPSFVNYDFATSSEIKWLVSVIKPVQPNEEYLLKRREGKDISYWNYITPKPMEDLTEQDYVMVFRSTDFTEMSQISEKLGDTKIYKWGKAKGYSIYYTYNPYIRGLLSERNILMEYGKAANPSRAIRYSPKVPKVKGDIEYDLNHFILISEKLENKTLEAEYWESGKIFPLKRSTFI